MAEIDIIGFQAVLLLSAPLLNDRSLFIEGNGEVLLIVCDAGSTLPFQRTVACQFTVGVGQLDLVLLADSLDRTCQLQNRQVIMDLLTPSSALDNFVVSPPISTVMPAILDAMRKTTSFVA